ncbi:MAG: hypothetical protein EB829_03775 [Nitrosopumilus sp. H8]|nr:MAG: hypothetical protein EB829_03775 [Nitrosopumilus sp. H8]
MMAVLSTSHNDSNAYKKFVKNQYKIPEKYENTVNDILSDKGGLKAYRFLKVMGLKMIKMDPKSSKFKECHAIINFIHVRHYKIVDTIKRGTTTRELDFMLENKFLDKPKKNRLSYDYISLSTSKYGSRRFSEYTSDSKSYHSVMMEFDKKYVDKYVFLPEYNIAKKRDKNIHDTPGLDHAQETEVRLPLGIIKHADLKIHISITPQTKLTPKEKKDLQNRYKSLGTMKINDI